MPELKLYTVADLREWLVHNHAAEGLSERIIAPPRAWAIIHNPYVKDDDAIVAAIFDNGELAAYTASFPEMIEGKRVWWASTLYCYPQFTGRGYGMIVVGSLIEEHKPELTYDRRGAKETVEIFTYFGFQTSYSTRYHLSNKKIDTSTLKGNLAYCAQKLKKRLHPWPKQSQADYFLRYASYIDGESYAFMRAHRGADLWLREQDMFNWILAFPFYLSGMSLSYEYKVVKVFFGNQLVGVSILRNRYNALAVLYIYYEKEKRNVVYDSIMDHIIAINPDSFITEDVDLFAYVRKRLYFPKMHKEEVSLSLPDMKQDTTQFSLQLGDGDSFA